MTLFSILRLLDGLMWYRYTNFKLLRLHAGETEFNENMTRRNKKEI